MNTINKTMRAIVRQQFGGPEQLQIQEIPIPEQMPEQVVIEVKAFGLNHVETHMRKGEGSGIEENVEAAALRLNDQEYQELAGVPEFAA